ncbi:anti-sigma factor [Streptomyces sp. MUM 203J]|uniref:anti-sigma factor n=1 Tax=Streptomyces sp. MUM 203J TaxID=2791990 RepID=UPI001F04AA40|nr:anti-sigma factor [Streptomyces sp. MUM 203J]MCH0542114.1 anti-sigma factor [Streptomyces sp. MUM 203J]
MTEEHLHAPTGAYALDALPDDEREAFERHLRDCRACAQEVRELTATAARLGLAVAAVPPPAMKESVIDRIRTVRQLPPEVPPSGPDRTAGRGRPLSRLVLAACLAAAAALGGVAVWQHQEALQAEQRAERTRQQVEEMARVLAAPDARTATGTVGAGTHATVVVSRAEDRAVFVASGLPELPGGRTYQLWFADGDSMRPAGLLRDDGAVVMDGEVGAATGMGITVEPVGGSPQPTTDPLAVMDLPS